MAILNGYCTLQELADKMGLDTAKTTLHTSLLEKSIENASRYIDNKTDSFFYQMTITNEIVQVGYLSDSGAYISHDCQAIVFPTPIISISSLSESGQALSEKTSFAGAGDFFIQKTQGLILKPDGGTWSTDDLAIEVSGEIGYANVPEEIREICLTVASVFSRLDNRLVADETGEIENILSSQIPAWVGKSLRRLRKAVV